MPFDVFAALGALVRAEAARSEMKSVPRPVTNTAHERTEERTDDAPASEGPDAAGAVTSGSPGTRRCPLIGTLRKPFRKLAALFR